MKLRKKLRLLEDFKTEAAQTTKTEVAIEATTDKAENTRTEVLSDVDAILTNLETLSAQITEGYLVNENIEEMMKGIKSIFAIAKAEMMLDKYGKLLMAADPTAQKNKVTLGTAKIQVKLDQITDSIKGKGISPEVKEKAAKQKKELREQMAGATEKAAMATEKAKNALAEYDTEIADVEKGISADSDLGKAYKAKKARLKNQVREESMTVAAEIAAKQGKDDAAKELKKEIADIQARQKEIEQKIQNGESLGKEEVAELKGIKAYMTEIAAIMKARENVTKVTTAAKEAVGAVKESLSAFNMVILESAVGDLFSKAKSKADVAGLNKAKELATAMKGAATAELEAVSALANKIKGKEVTKSVIGLAGGDMDKAQEGEGGFKLGEFIPKYGEGANLKKAEDLAAVKSADEVLQAVDQAIIDAEEEPEGETEKTSKQLADDFIAGDEGEGFKVITDKGAEVPVPNPETGEDEQKPKYEDEQDFTGKKEDGSDDDVVTVAKEIDYSTDTDESKTVEEVAEEAIGDTFNTFTGPLTKEEVDAKESVTGEDGNDTEKDKYTDKQGPYKAKDAEGTDTGEDTYWAKLDDSSSAATVSGKVINEGMSVAEKFAILMNK